MTLLKMHSQSYFNPRLREGGDDKNSEWITNLEDFNPRLREGGDVG